MDKDRTLNLNFAWQFQAQSISPGHHQRLTVYKDDDEAHLAAYTFRWRDRVPSVYQFSGMGAQCG